MPPTKKHAACAKIPEKQTCVVIKKELLTKRSGTTSYSDGKEYIVQGACRRMYKM